MAGIENWTDKVISTLENKDIVYVKTSEGLDIHKIGEKDSQEDNKHSHGSYDPHTWLSIKNAKQEMENIKNALAKYDPDNADYYEDNYEKYAKKFDELDKKYSDTLGPIKNKTIIVAHEAFGKQEMENIKNALVKYDSDNADYYEDNYEKYAKKFHELDKKYSNTFGSIKNKTIMVAHEAFGYLCEEYDINQEGIEGLTPDSEPDPARMSQIIKFAKKNNVKTIFFEELVSPKVAQTIAKEINAKTEVLNPLEGLSEEQINNGEDYFSVMEKNLEVLYESMK